MNNRENMPNRLIQEKSPYLLQHAYNPVDWYPWCPEAFIRARREHKPIFLSIGYSACHWCHVFERESFRDPEVAELLNRSFISIKVDKEERPDLDAVYMAVCQAFTGQGGWPTTILITPEQKPFFAGTYFPKARLLELLKGARAAWDSNPEKLNDTGNQVIGMLSGTSAAGEAEPKINRTAWSDMGMDLPEKAEKYFAQAFDTVWGGFGKAPKFPAPHNLLFLLKVHELRCGITVPEEGRISPDSQELAMVEKTLQQMYAGGMYDHVGYGFCRYSTDEKWLVPHFEKMLYDNALLCMAYTECWRVTKKVFYRRVAEEILEYVMREMHAPEGGFYSAQDADSEGEEGKYYVFRPEEVLEVLGQEQGEWFCQQYGITEEGNFEGASVPNLIRVLSRTPEKIPGLVESAEWSADASVKDSRMRRYQNEMKKKLYQYRKQRAVLRTDDKILTAWNCLMIVALARAYQAFGGKEYLEAAKDTETFLRARLMKRDGTLLVRYRDGDSAGEGFLDDYAFYEWALMELLGASHRVSYLQRAMEIQSHMVDHFWDSSSGGFYFTGEDQEALIFRPKETYDGAMPSGNSAAAYAMVMLYEKMGETESRRERIEQQLSYLAESGRNRPADISFGLTALMEWMCRQKNN